MKRLLKDPNKLVPGGFVFIPDPNGDITLEDVTFKKLVTRASNYYKTNNLPVPADLPELIQQQMCATLDNTWCKDVSEGVGDTTAKFIQATGLKAAFQRKNRTAGCKGCAARQKKLNKLFPYRR